MKRTGVLLVCLTLIVSVAAEAAATGSWSGRWQRAPGQYGAGSGLFTLAQKGARVTGVYHWKGCAAVFGGTIVGTVTGRSLAAVFNHKGDARGTLRLHLSPNGRHITGSFKVTAGTCAGTAGAFDASRLRKPQ